MSVTNYTPDNCRYWIGKLSKHVYLISEDAVKDIRIDNGEAWVQSVSESPIRIDCISISLSEEESLDERYKFVHTLSFSVNGYANKDDFQGRYYVIVKDNNNTYWLVNPLFPCKVTYTYTLANEQNQTDFTIGTASNHPVLKLNGMSEGEPYQCQDYWLDGIDKIWLNEKRYSVHDGNNVKYTNDGFKVIDYNGKSATFTESFDGENTRHSIEFNVLFSDYKSSWHYNLLEIVDECIKNNNLYSAIIKTRNDKYAMCGFSFGLQPSFNISADDTTQEINRIQITLQDAHTVGDAIDILDSVNYEYLSARTWVYTDEYDGYECLGNGVAKYLLQKEVDALGNDTCLYKVLTGYASLFPELNIVGEFNETVEFIKNECTSDICSISVSFPFTIRFTEKGTQTYTLYSDTEWSILSSNPGILVSPTTGDGGRYYVISIENTIEPTNDPVSAYLTLSYCERTRNINVLVMLDDDSCLYLGRTYNISANAQTVSIPSNCCILSVKESTRYYTQLTHTDYNISAYVPDNNSGAYRTIILLVVFCDGTSQNVIINQSNVFEKWTSEGTTCIDNDLYAIERLYTGTTSGSMTARTDTVRETLVEVNSRRCITPEHKTVDTGNYMCEECVPYKYFNTISSGDSFYTVTGGCNSTTLVPADISARTDIESSQVGSCVTAIGAGAFSGCTNIGFINLPDGIVSIGDMAFANCSAAGNIAIPLTVTSIGNNAFSGCTSLGDVTLPNNIESIGTGAFRECKNFPLVNIPKSLTSIPSYCFYDCDGLFSVEFHEDVTSIGDYAFANCNGMYIITSLAIIPPTAGSNTFTGLSSIGKVYVPSQSVDAYKAATGWSVLSNNIFPIQ